MKAIDAVNRADVIDMLEMYPFTEYGEYETAREVVKRLPSAQPEIIRCKDCKHHWTHRCMDSMPTEICDLDQTFYDPNIDFCSLAERRTDGSD